MSELDAQLPSAKWGLLAIVYSLPVLIVFAVLGDFRRGLTASICVALIVGIIKTYWILRKHAWFWITVTILAALHIPIVILLPIPATRQFTVWELLPVAVLDLAVMYGCIKLVAKVMNNDHAIGSGRGTGAML